MTEAVRVLGIDPGTRSVGYGIVEQIGSRQAAVCHGCIRCRGDEMSQRLVQIHRELQDVIREHRPTVAAIESVFAGENIRTAIAIGEGRGVAVLSAAELGLEVVGYEPAVVKRAVAGSGRAGKEQIQQMVRVLLCLPQIPETDHEADALALALTHLHRSRFGLPAKQPPARGRRRAGFRR